MKSKITLIFILGCVAFSFANDKKAVKQYVSNLKEITDVMVYDVTSPVASARYYAYATLASYEVLSFMDQSQNPSLLNVVNPSLQMKGIAIDKAKIDLCATTNLAMLKTAYLLLPSGTKLKPAIETILTKIKSSKRIESEKLADLVSTTIQKWALTDGFLQLNNLRKYTPKRGQGFWQPTAPAYMAPVEPNWRTLRPFFLDSSAQFRPALPKKYDESKDSPFMKELMEVYEVSKKLTKEQNHIANFWDCNPYMISQIGHVEFGVKKISPGGHWMGIAGITCKNTNSSFMKTVFTHALLGMTLHDSFIACWDEKYNSDRIRPETAINRIIDKTWRPLIQTPPFPEYVSGHSVASTAAAKILTKLLGDNIKFTDDTELEFNIPKRKFTSFNQAASEAAISRLYGGIHYRDAIENGAWQGSKVGDLVLRKMESIVKMFN